MILKLLDILIDCLVKAACCVYGGIVKGWVDGGRTR